jgi:hypothetical protein
MITRARRVAAMAAVAVILAVPAPAGAHRLDEYLQATRIGVNADSVELDIDLTAGVALAPRVWALIDADRNGRISESEGRRYADVVLKAIELQVDHRPCAVALTASRFPSLQDINSGSGMIQLRARATLPPATVGRHQLFFRNTHRRAMSVYLVNALVPSNPAITIASQQRDPRQMQMLMTYNVAAAH